MDLMLSSRLLGHEAHRWYTDTHSGKIPIHIKINLRNKQRSVSRGHWKGPSLHNTDDWKVYGRAGMKARVHSLAAVLCLKHRYGVLWASKCQ